MGKYASEIVKVMQSWIGRNEAAGTHKAIIDIYNSHRPLPRGYTVKYTDEWCATTTSAAAIKLGYTDIIPIECSCSKIIAKAKEMGIWVEDESATPKAGWLCIYDWQDSSGKKDNKGDPDHIGLVEKVTGNTFVVIEGNYSNSVKRRTLEINGKYLRGFVAPKYDTEKATKPAAQKKAYTGTFPKLPARGYFAFGDTGTQVKNLQKFLNWYGNYKLVVDGEIGAKTIAAVREFQSRVNIKADGLFGKNSLARAKAARK